MLAIFFSQYVICYILTYTLYVVLELYDICYTFDIIIQNTFIIWL